MSFQLSSQNKLLLLFSLFFICILCLCGRFSIFQTTPLNTEANTTTKPSKLIKAKEGMRDECHTLPKTLGAQAPLCVKLNDKLVSKSVRNGGLWERAVLTMVLRALSKFPKSVLIDGGANVGEFTVMAAAMGHEVIAVEPMVDNIQVYLLCPWTITTINLCDPTITCMYVIILKYISTQLNSFLAKYNNTMGQQISH